jgi:hypothetical protein
VAVETCSFLDEALELWHAAPGTATLPARPVGVALQAAREPEMERFLSALEAELKRPPATRAARADAHGRISAAFVRLGRSGLGLDEAELKLLLEGGFASIGTLMARQARRFDPAVELSDVMQASRNAWTACGLQLLLGRQMELTPSIFAYSMLYPYTDNYLDDGSVPAAEKRAFGERFGRRLAGCEPEPANPAEQCIWRLVGQIEDQYARRAFPDVYESLLDIHRAQCVSARLRMAVTDDEMLRIGFAKGGTSVLADAWLAAGHLSPQPARFAYLWGVLLQLGDDLQDLREDLAAGVATVFTRAAVAGSMEAATRRTLAFARPVLALMAGLDGPPELKKLISHSTVGLLIRAAGEAAEYYPAAFVSELEARSPFSFAYLERRRRRLAQNSGAMQRLFEAFLAGDDDEPAFPHLPSSLMPRV